MKKFLYFLTGFIAFILTACSKTQGIAGDAFTDTTNSRFTDLWSHLLYIAAFAVVGVAVIIIGVIFYFKHKK